MKRNHLSALLLAASVAACTIALAKAPDGEKPKPAQAAMDKPVPDFKLKDLMKDPKEVKKEDDAFVSLASFKDKKPVVLFFMSEKCSVTWRYERRVGDLLKKYGKDVAFFGVRCSANDTPQGLCKFAETKNFDMPLLNDEKGQMTRFYNIHQTPTFVLIDKSGALRYKGGFDDSADENSVKQKYLADAIAAVLDNKLVVVKETRALG